MDPALFQQMFRVNHGALHQNLDGVTSEEALIQPRPDGNCLNWIVGHVTSSRNGILRLLGAEPIWGPDDAKRYARSSAPIKGPGDGVPFDRIVADFDAAQERILGALERARPADLERPYQDGQSVAHWLAFAHFHEAYHIGQTGLVRRLIGKEGAIR
jgi:hypothetical protein